MSIWQRLVRGKLRTSAVPAWTNAVGPDYAQSIMNWAAADDYHAKQGRSTGRFVRGGLLVYVKRHWRLPWKSWLLAVLDPKGNWSPAAAEWEHLRWARSQGLPVPEPLAFGEWVGPGFRMHSFLVVRELTGMLALHEAVPLASAIMRAEAFERWKGQIIRQMAELARQLHLQDRFHKDLYLCHFYVTTPQTQHANPGTVHLIDLHRLGRHRWLQRRWLVKDLAQLLFSTWGVRGINNRDRLNFLRTYLGVPFFGRQERALVQAVVRKAQRYARHNRVVPASVVSTRKAAA